MEQRGTGAGAIRDSEGKRPERKRFWSRQAERLIESSTARAEGSMRFRRGARAKPARDGEELRSFEIGTHLARCARARSKTRRAPHGPRKAFASPARYR